MGRVERAKTIRSTNKKAGIAVLIDEVATSPAMHERLDNEAITLTNIGNNFRIRHHETDKTPVEPGDVDYLFHRMFALLAHLLRLEPHP